jgi:hypothetical protein
VAQCVSAWFNGSTKAGRMKHGARRTFLKPCVLPLRALRCCCVWEGGAGRGVKIRGGAFNHVSCAPMPPTPMYYNADCSDYFVGTWHLGCFWLFSLLFCSRIFGRVSSIFLKIAPFTTPACTVRIGTGPCPGPCLAPPRSPSFNLK